jgi:glycine dehydrogenase
MRSQKDGAISAAPFGSTGMQLISWLYIKMNGEPALKAATSHAILNANYMTAHLNGACDILFIGKSGQ